MTNSLCAQAWGGGAACSHDETSLCFNNGKVLLPFGSPQYVGLGFSVFSTIILVELFGSPFMRNCAVSGLVLMLWLAAYQLGVLPCVAFPSPILWFMPRHAVELQLAASGHTIKVKRSLHTEPSGLCWM